MKLITKLYLAFGLILLTFICVTLIFIVSSKEVESDSHAALNASDIQRLSEAQQKSLLDMETGLRGYWVTGKPEFLEPYYSGLIEYEQRRLQLDSLIQIPYQRKKLKEIDSIFYKWKKTFAEPSIYYQTQALSSDSGILAFTNFKTDYILKGVGKKMIDQIRNEFNAFDSRESALKESQMKKLYDSIYFTNILAISLTAVTTLIGIIIALFLGNTIKKRLQEMVDMAHTIAQGNFKVKINDTNHDEISRLSDSLNVMALKLNSSFSTLQKKNKELDQFAYVVSHDLKAPLRAINNLAEWLDEDITDTDPDIRKNLNLMRGRVHRLENLIDGILAYSRIGRRQLSSEKVDLNLLLQELIDSLSPGSRFQIHIQPKFPVLVTERILLEQVFTNLIGNAFKYQDKPEGNVWINWAQKNNTYEFQVKDDGPGIAPEFHDKVFTIFQTIESRDTRESTGVGLAIVQKIIEEKGGQIRIESELGKGASFIFTWPEKPVTAYKIADFTETTI